MARIDTVDNDEPVNVVSQALQQADEFKTQGNDHFRAKAWSSALSCYQSGLEALPRRPEKPEKADAHADVDDDENDPPTTQEPTQPEPPTPEELEYAKARSVLNSNIGACYLKLGDHKAVVDACTQALLDDPNYVKALQRRAASNETLDTWSSLTAAMEDYTTLLKILPPSSALIKEIERSQAVLKPRHEAAQKRETDEMMGKLKGIGNSILGNFGLSTDNFQFVPNGQGGYSMNFQR
ncbi:unnamed protein product [Mycena citricolor]|uniref:TPR-like protein n=1 Tax=Mycena citricolor TaxID=2018698 RepID=A0AAD2Q5Z9_9AGAR|nr:unnamed protein product [Mycena citricolor]CAK5280013.1 unnamed protein product [Mycena citricolor]